MKKRKVILVICLIIIIGLFGFISFNNRIVTVITLDINPSIQINLTRSERVKSIIALNDDAKTIISKNLSGKTLDETLSIITDNVIKEGYSENRQVLIVLYSAGSIDNKELEEKVRRNFEEKDIFTEVVLVDDVSKEDTLLAQKYNISPAKASYINSIVKENENIEITSLIDKSAKELKETKETGKYCDEGYTLEWDICLKEISRVPSSTGDVCPNGYFEEDGKCYEEVSNLSSEPYCEENDELRDGKCVEFVVEDAIPQYSCSKGELVRKGDVSPIGSSDNDKYYCVDKSTGEAPVLRCLKNSGHIILDGKCYNGPAPLINGGCPGDDIPINGWCYSLDDEDQWECPNGGIYERSKGTIVDLCPDTFTYIEPTITGYKCDDSKKTLNGSKCTYENIKPALQKITCPEDSTKNREDRCINYSHSKSKEKGLVCNQENSRLKGNQCIIYEIIDAKHN